MEKTTKFQLKKIKTQSKIFIQSLRHKQPLVSGFGFHIISIPDFKEKVQHKSNLLNLLFTSEELSYCDNRPNSLAGRYAAKAAIRKALQQKIPWSKISIPSSETRQPRIAFLDKNSNISISITHDKDIAAAFVAYSINDFTSGNEHNVQIGLDIAYVSRMAKLISKRSESLLRRIATSEEQIELNNNVQKIVEKWSGKEAISKALGTGIGQGVTYQNIEILTHGGKPIIRLTGEALAHARAKNLQNWDIAYMHLPKFTLAFVIAST